MVFAVLVGTLVGMLGITAQASADATYIGGWGYESRCYDAGHKLCLYRLPDQEGAYWGTSVSDNNLEDRYYRTAGYGQNEKVKNNSESVMCGWSALPNRCFIWFNSGFEGDVDWLNAGETGNLVQTFSENASAGFRP